MSSFRIQITSIITFLLILYQFLSVSFNDVSLAANSEDVYDVILFWGQSNMVGVCGKKEPERESNDPRYNGPNSLSIDKYSALSGINKTFLTNAKLINYVYISQHPNTVYEYKYTTN